MPHDRALPAWGEVIGVEVRGTDLDIGVASDPSQRDQLLATEPVSLLNRREREGTVQIAGINLRRDLPTPLYEGCVGDGAGEVAEPGVFEDGAYRDGAAQFVAKAGGQPHRQQRMAPQREEGVTQH